MAFGPRNRCHLLRHVTHYSQAGFFDTTFYILVEQSWGWQDNIVCSLQVFFLWSIQIKTTSSMLLIMAF